MRRPLAPLWLAAPTRFAALSQAQARVAIGIVAALLIATLLALAAPAPPASTHDPAARAKELADVVLYESIVEGVRHDGGYYAVAAQALRSGNYPLRPFVTFRLPTLARVQAALPGWGVLALLWTLCVGVVVAWHARLKPAFVRVPPRVVALVLLAGGMAAFVQPELVAFHEIWAGLLIALSLALRRPGVWVTAAAIGLAAMLIRETSALYVAIMAAVAWVEGARREALGWTATLGVLAVAVAAHAYAVAQVVGPLDPQSPGWAGMLGFGFFVRTIAISTALAQVPLALAAPLVGVALVGWAGWRDALAVRALAVFVGYAMLLGIAGRVDTFYWGLLIAPTILIGLAAAPDALRDLFAAAKDARRITVTRVVR